MALTLDNTDNVFDDGTLLLNGPTSLTTAVLGSTTFLFVADQDDDGVGVFVVTADGILISVGGGNVTDAGALELDGAVSLTAAVIGGTTFLFAAGELDDGVSVFSVAANGILTNVAAGGNVTDDATFELDGARSVTTAVAGGITYLFAASATDDGLSVFSVAGTGALTNVDNVPDDGMLELDFAVSVTTAVIGATTFLFAAGAVDDGISVFSVAGTGELTNVDNVTDDATLNLNSIGSVATAVVGGTTYLFAGGGDNGISVFSVAANGTLTSEFNIADNATTHLSDIESMTTAKIAGITYLFTADSSEGGVSVFAVADDGTLINVANVEDDGTLALDGTFNVHVAALGGSAYLFVAGNADEGVSVFRINVTGLTINGTGGNDIINAVSSAPGQLLPSELGDTINGLNGNDVINALGGADKVFGGGGTDTMTGGNGNDILTGGNGRDTHNGGLGADRFDFNTIAETKTGILRDRINDFKRGQADKIDLAGIDAKTGIAGNQKFTFIGDDAFSGEKGELRFTNKIVQGDVNGDGNADFQIFVNVGNLVAGDFLL